jgi:hypothetical protein
MATVYKATTTVVALPQARKAAGVQVVRPAAVQNGTRSAPIKPEKGPKHNMSSYMYFVQKQRADVKKSNPNIDNKTVISLLGKMWRGLGDAERQPYNELAKTDRERYLREKAEWERKNPNFTLGKSGGRPAKNVGKGGGPKRAMSAYMFFVKKTRGATKSANMTLDNRAVIALLGKQWRSMGEVEKAKYRAMAEADKQRFENEKKTWVYTMVPNKKLKKRVRRTMKEIKEGKSLAEVKKIRASQKSQQAAAKKKRKASQAIAKANKKAKKEKKKKRDPNMPKRNMSSYMFFVKMRRDGLRKSNPNIGNKDVISLLGALWRGLEADAKKEYQDLAAQDKIRYDKELAAYKASSPMRA